MELNFLGTGTAFNTKTYNACFTVSKKDSNKYFLVDGGGGNQLFQQLEKAEIDPLNITDIFVTHKHTDHILGIVWLVRLIGHHMNSGKHQGIVNVYANSEVIDLLRTINTALTREADHKFIDDRIVMNVVDTGDSAEIFGRKITFFEIENPKVLLHGFKFEYADGRTLTCTGDIPANDSAKEYLEGSTYLVHEAYCSEQIAHKYNPAQYNHCTSLEAAKIADKYGADNLIMYHSRDDDLENRQKIFIEEAKTVFSGEVYAPYDLDIIEIK